MSYSEETLSNLSAVFNRSCELYRDFQGQLLMICNGFDSDKSKEYMSHGVCRRLKTVMLSLENIFSLFPPSQNKLLDKNTLANIEINLHAFFINVSGLLDNLAWCCVYEHKAKTNIMLKKHDIGLFKNKTQKILGKNLHDLVSSERIVKWYESYSKNFRDALAHRIPLYIPPSVLDEEEAIEYQRLNNEIGTLDLSTQKGIERWGNIIHTQSSMGRVAFFFSHSLDEGGRPLWVHPQILSDMQIIEEIIQAFISDNSKPITKPSI